MGQEPPARTGTRHPAQGVEDLAQIIVALRGIKAHQRQIGEDEVPFIVGDIGGVGFAFGIHPPSVLPSQVHNSL